MTAVWPKARGSHRATWYRPPTMRKVVGRSPRRRIAATVTVAVAVVGLAVLGTHITTPPAPARAAAVTAGLTPAEAIYLTELADADITVPASAQPVMVEVARKHVSHGHLVGMRQWIRDDVRAALPDLDAGQVDTARVVVEHHFQRATGRKQ